MCVAADGGPWRWWQGTAGKTGAGHGPSGVDTVQGLPLLHRSDMEELEAMAVCKEEAARL